MGTAFSLAISDPGGWEEAIEEVVAWLHRVDELFSTYRPGSEISRLARGELSLADADPLVREVLEMCEQYERETGGYFSAHLPGGLDPTGLVKGWAIERASEILRRHGSHNHAVNGGGDLQLAGEAAPGQPWRIGIADPFDRTRVLTTVTCRDGAVATSGTAERGHHVIDPRTGQPPRGLASVTVVGASLTRVDVYATAALAMGDQARSWLDGLADHDGLFVAARQD